jgi:replication factor C subunit 3/5
MKITSIDGDKKKLKIKMSMWCDKYRPKTLDQLDLNRDHAKHLKRLTQRGEMPHLSLFGQSGVGKKTLANAIIYELYGPKIEKQRLIHKQFSTSAKKKFHTSVARSAHHLEVNPSDATIHDRFVVQELIKSVATERTIDDKLPFKVVIITEADRLTREAQQCLRRTMEKYASSCRVILIGETSSRVIPSLISRCLSLRIAAPSHSEIKSILMKIAEKENKELSHDLAEEIAIASGRNMRRAIIIFERSVTLSETCMVEPSWLLCIQSIADDMINTQSVRQIGIIRNKFYELCVHLIPPELIMRELVKKLLPLCEHRSQQSLVQLAADFEHKMHLGSKTVIHFEAFVANFMTAVCCKLNV